MGWLKGKKRTPRKVATKLGEKAKAAPSNPPKGISADEIWRWSIGEEGLKKAPLDEVRWGNTDDYITIRMRREDAEHWQLGMADLLCWVAGFKAATPEDSGRHPGGYSQTQNVREAIVRALEAPKGTN